MTDEEIERVYLNYLDSNVHVKSIPQLANILDLSVEQVENLLEVIKWKKSFPIAKEVRKATYADRYPVEPSSNIIRFPRP